ncbi:hypothetical protein [Oceanospirillum beijerinckii]|uniref:hypothetical protein n=1 Tax=Oceanospirillum beijerinckii TaxID=64976 RepID=UPI000688E5DD|nr:hypothetical protein [Oceanospirillum beijerinckii]
MLKLIKFNLLITVLMLLHGCSSGATVSGDMQPGDSQTLVDFAYSLTSEQSCHQAGGSWEKVGRRQKAACVLPTSDRGKRCSDNKQCEVACIVSKRGIKAGDAVEGQCHHSTNLFGCKARVVDGVARPTLCID